MQQLLSFIAKSSQAVRISLLPTAALALLAGILLGPWWVLAALAVPVSLAIDNVVARDRHRRSLVQWYSQTRMITSDQVNPIRLLEHWFWDQHFTALCYRGLTSVNPEFGWNYMCPLLEIASTIKDENDRWQLVDELRLCLSQQNSITIEKRFDAIIDKLSGISIPALIDTSPMDEQLLVEGTEQLHRRKVRTPKIVHDLAFEFPDLEWAFLETVAIDGVVTMKPKDRSLLRSKVLETLAAVESGLSRPESNEWSMPNIRSLDLDMIKPRD